MSIQSLIAIAALWTVFLPYPVRALGAGTARPAVPAVRPTPEQMDRLFTYNRKLTDFTRATSSSQRQIQSPELAHYARELSRRCQFVNWTEMFLEDARQSRGPLDLTYLTVLGPQCPAQKTVHVQGGSRPWEHGQVILLRIDERYTLNEGDVLAETYDVTRFSEISETALWMTADHSVARTDLRFTSGIEHKDGRHVAVTTQAAMMASQTRGQDQPLVQMTASSEFVFTGPGYPPNGEKHRLQWTTWGRPADQGQIEIVRTEARWNELQLTQDEIHRYQLSLGPFFYQPGLVNH